ncbi:hypothetical protein PFISCL1PPCAC_22125, partial [Pristionchus fissidentatus]
NSLLLVDLLPEMIDHIFGFVGESELLELRAVCRKTKSIVDSAAAARKPFVHYMRFEESESGGFDFSFSIDSSEMLIFAVNLCDWMSGGNSDVNKDEDGWYLGLVLSFSQIEEFLKTINPIFAGCEIGSITVEWREEGTELME